MTDDISEDQDILDSRLILAIRKKSDFNIKKDKITKLVTEGANVNAKCRDTKFSGYTPLHLAIELDDTQIVKYLLTVDNVNPNIKNYLHETPLAFAQRLQKTAIIKELTDHSVVTKQPIEILNEDKDLRLYDGIPVLSTDLIIKLANRSYQTKPSHQEKRLPSDHVLSRLVLSASTIVNQAQLLPKGWTLLTAERNELEDGDYVGSAYWNVDQQQIVVAHRCNCNATDVSKDEWDGFTFDDMIPFINSTITFSHKILNLMNDLNKSGLHFTLSFTGHSFGGWLAQIAAFSVKYLIKNKAGVYVVNENTGYHAHTVVFDSPGCKEALLDIKSRLNSPLTKPLNALDITIYVSAPNRVNTCNTHIGIVYRIFVDLTYAEHKASKCRLVTPSMESIAQSIDPNIGHVKLDELKIYKVLEWPKLRPAKDKKESKKFYQLAAKLHHLHSYPIDLSFSENGIHYRIRKFNQTEFQMRFECQAQLQRTEERSDICKEFYEVQSKDYLETIEQNQLLFATNFAELDEFFKSDIKFLHMTHNVPYAGVLIIYKYLLQSMRESDYKVKDCLFLAVRHILSVESDFSFLKYLLKADLKLLIFECQPSSEVQLFLDIDYSSLLEALPPECKIILISDSYCKLHCQDVTKPILFDGQYHLRDLNETPGLTIIKYPPIDFQSKSVISNSEFPREFLLKLLHLELFIKLGSQDGIKIGNELPFFRGIDIQRTLTPLKLEFSIDADCLKNSKLDIFAISNISVDELKPVVSEEETICLYQSFSENQGCRFIILENNDANSQFQKLSDTQGHTNNVHWLHKVKFVKDFDIYNNCDEIIWRNTTGSFNELKFKRYNADRKAAECRKTVGWGSNVTANDISDPFVVITGIAGMGKSTFLSQLAIQIKESYPSHWVVPIDMSTWAPNMTSQLESVSSFSETDRAIQFLIDVSNLTSNHDIRLIKDYLWDPTNPYKVVVLIDGSDEIAGKHKQVIANLVKTLKSIPIKQIWLSCHPITLREMDFQEVSYVAYSLDELTEQQQKQLICSGQSDKKFEDLFGFIKELNKNISLTPLHLIMLAELNCRAISHKSHLNIVNIYELYIMKKLEDVYGENHHSIVTLYQSMALLALFPDDFAWLLPRWTQERTLELINSIEQGHQQSALLSGIVNGVPQFVHRTLAEYLAAHWFMDTLAGDSEMAVHNSLKETGSSNSKWIELPNEIVQLDKNVESLRLKRIFEFFAVYVLHGENTFASHVCNLNDNFMTRLKVNTNNEDNVNFQLLHFAAVSGYSHLVKGLIKGIDGFLNKHYFQHIPLYYAVKNQNENVVEAMLIELRVQCGPKAFENILEVTGGHLLHLAAYLNNDRITYLLLDSCNAKRIDSVNDINDTPLHVASNFGSEDTAQLLIWKGAELNLFNKYNHTPLYLACEQGHLKIVKSLVMAGAHINQPPFPLHTVVKKGQAEFEADINLKGENFYENTPLSLAVEKGNVEMVECLLSSDVNRSYALRCEHLLVEKCKDEQTKWRIKGILSKLECKSFKDFIEQQHPDEYEQMMSGLHRGWKRNQHWKHDRDEKRDRDLRQTLARERNRQDYGYRDIVYVDKWKKHQNMIRSIEQDTNVTVRTREQKIEQEQEKMRVEERDLVRRRYEEWKRSQIDFRWDYYSYDEHEPQSFYLRDWKRLPEFILYCEDWKQSIYCQTVEKRKLEKIGDMSTGTNHKAMLQRSTELTTNQPESSKSKGSIIETNETVISEKGTCDF